MNESDDIKDKLLEINQIFDELIGDALGLSKDLVLSIRQWLFSSAFCFLVSALYFYYVMYPVLVSADSLWSLFLNITFYWCGLAVILFVFLGFYSIWKYLSLKEKYARLFAIQEALSKGK